MLLLFKPWRSLKKDILACVLTQPVCCTANPWQLLYEDFEKWFAHMGALSLQVRREYQARTLAEGQTSFLCADGSVSWHSSHYWAARSVPVMKTMRTSFTKQKDSTDKTPTFFHSPGDTADVESETDQSNFEEASVVAPVRDRGDSDDDGPLRGIAKVVGNPCGKLPSEPDALKQLMLCEDMLKGYGKEARYCRLTHSTWKESAVGLIKSSSLVARVVQAPFDVSGLAHVDIDKWHSDQTDYF